MADDSYKRVRDSLQPLSYVQSHSSVHSEQKKPDCFGVFSLKVGVMLIVTLDVLFCAFLIGQFGLRFKQAAQI